MRVFLDLSDEGYNIYLIRSLLDSVVTWINSDGVEYIFDTRGKTYYNYSKIYN